MFFTTYQQIIFVLYSTYILENLLKKKGYKGTSLSDKIKSCDSYGEYDAFDDEEAYAYRSYKRDLLGGYFNDLRWVAHERNQILHKDNYKIVEFFKFTRTINGTIRFLNTGESYKGWGVFLFYFSFFVAIITIVFEPTKIIRNIDSIGDIIVPTLVMLVIAGGIVRLYENKIVENISGIITAILTFTYFNKIKALLIVIIYWLWDKDVEYLTYLFIKYKDIILQLI